MDTFCRKDATKPPPLPHDKPGRVINHRRKRGNNLKPFVFPWNGEPRIFFMVNVDIIPMGKQICYDYADQGTYADHDNLGWLKTTDESSDDEGKSGSH